MMKNVRKKCCFEKESQYSIRMEIYKWFNVSQIKWNKSTSQSSEFSLFLFALNFPWTYKLMDIFVFVSSRI